jgi:hypothetical protein
MVDLSLWSVLLIFCKACSCWFGTVVRSYYKFNLRISPPLWLIWSNQWLGYMILRLSMLASFRSRTWRCRCPFSVLMIISVVTRDRFRETNRTDLFWNCVYVQFEIQVNCLYVGVKLYWPSVFYMIILIILISSFAVSINCTQWAEILNCIYFMMLVRCSQKVMCYCKVICCIFCV